jgi:hypothetical protein
VAAHADAEKIPESCRQALPTRSIGYGIESPLFPVLLLLSPSLIPLLNLVQAWLIKLGACWWKGDETAGRWYFPCHRSQQATAEYLTTWGFEWKHES